MNETYTFLSVMSAIIIAGIVATWKMYVKPYNEDMPSLDNLSPEEPYIPASPVIIAPDAPKQPPEPVIEPSAPNLPLDFSTPQKAFKSTRIMCDNANLTYDVKNEICYTIWNESQFLKGAIGKPNKNGTRDYGLCQYNNGTNAKGIPFWIGKGATFKDIDEVLNNPEKNVRVMIQTYKAGNIRWWYGHIGYSQATVMQSPMWKLRV